MVKKMVNLSTEEIQKYCSQYKLSNQESAPYHALGIRYYYDEKEKLALLKDADGNQAYSEEQINKLIFRKFSKNTVTAVIRLHEQLILDLSPSFIFKIAAHDGGSKNLDAFITATQNLRNQGQTWQTLGISIDDVARILSNNGGHIKLQKLFQYSPLLFNLGFSIKDIIKAVLLPVMHFSIMVKFVHDLSKKFTPQEMVALSKNRAFKKNIHDILSRIESNHIFNFTEEEILVLNDIFSLDNDQISPISSSDMHASDVPEQVEATDHALAFLALLELFDDSTPLINNSMFNRNKHPRNSEESSHSNKVPKIH